MNPSATLAIAALYGLGGVGKTQLATEYAHRYAAEFDIAWWVDAEQPLLIPAQLAMLADRLGIRRSSGSALVGELLNTLGDRDRWLIVFDNATSPHDIASLRPRAGGSIIVTSRYPGWGDIGDRLEVGVLSRGDTVALLRARLPDADPADSATLAAELGDLPLAVMQAAAYLEQSGTTVREYLDRFTRDRATLLARGDVIGYQGRIDTAWLLALERLTVESPATVELLKQAAFLAPEPIPLSLFISDNDPAGTVPHHVWSHLDAVADAVTAGVRYSLARRQSDDTFLIHRLVQSVIRHRLEPAEREAVLSRVTTMLGRAWLGDPNDPSTWAAYRQLAPHLLHIGADADVNAELRQLLLNSVAYTNFRGDPRSSRTLAETLYQRWRKTLGDDHADVLSAAAALTSAMTWTGEHESARSLAEDTLERSRRALGPDHPITLRLATNLTFALAWLGNSKAACDLGMDSLDRSRRTFGTDHPEPLRLAANVIVALIWQNRTTEALSLAEDTLRRSRQALGPDNPVTLVTAAHLAMVHGWLGNMEADLEVGEQTLAQARLALGDNHPTTLASSAHLAFILIRLGRDDPSTVLARDSFERARHTLGANHLITLIAGAIHALVLATTGSATEALQLSTDQLSRSQVALGADHFITLINETALITSLVHSGRPAEARLRADEAMPRLVKTFGSSHLVTATLAQTLKEIKPQPGVS